MKFTATQSNFAKALNQVSRVVGTRTTLPVLGNILISAGKGKINLSATDLEVAVTTKTLGKVEEEGVITIPARLLSDFILNNNDESIDFESSDNLNLQLKSKHFSAHINGISAEEFPTIPSLPKDLFCTFKSEDFIDTVKKVAIAPANDETRPVLAGIYFNFSGKLLTLAATDSFRLAEKKLALDETIEDKKFIVPSRTMIEVLRLLSSDSAANISISSTENQIAFKIGETEVVSRLIEGAFPNYSQIIPSSSKIKAVVSHKDFSNAVKMVSLFAKNSANNIRIKTLDNKLVISSISTETGDATSEIEAEVTGGELQIAFNARYVLDVLSVISENKIILEFNDTASAGVIRSEKDKDFTYIIMPLKIDE
jgi:DNA polymerase-3 subunit beta